jgi:hypothetical protein
MNKTQLIFRAHLYREGYIQQALSTCRTLVFGEIETPNLDSRSHLRSSVSKDGVGRS